MSETRLVSSVHKPDEPALAETLAGSIARLRAKGRLPPDATHALGRLEVALRTVVLDRRLAPRFPCAVAVQIACRAGTFMTVTLDIGAQGLMIDRPSGLLAIVGEQVVLWIEGVGEVQASLVAVDNDTLSVHVAEISHPAVEDAYTDLLSHLECANAEGVERARTLAQDVAFAFEDALADGVVTASALFSRDYCAIAGTRPAQHDHPAAAFFEATLDPLLARHFMPEDRMVHAIATDVNGYVPVHNRRFSQPQRPDDLRFNRRFSWNKRIFADRWTLKAARFSQGPLVQTMQREAVKGQGRIVRDFSCPIIVAGRRWGAAQIGYALD